MTDERLKEKMTIRKLLLGSAKLMDPKNEKNGTYDIAPPVSLLTLIPLGRREIL